MSEPTLPRLVRFNAWANTRILEGYVGVASPSLDDVAYVLERAPPP